MELDEKWMREHLPEDCRNERIDVFSGYHLDGLKVMSEGERGAPDTVIFEARDEEDLRWWQLEQICRFAGKAGRPGIWRWYRHHAENGRWLYVERRHYDYDAIEDARLPGFERFLRNLRFGFPRDRWEEKVREHVDLMNFWYSVPHWDYDREELRFVEISSSREHDVPGGPEEPRPGSVIGVID